MGLGVGFHLNARCLACRQCGSRLLPREGGEAGHLVGVRVRVRVRVKGRARVGVRVGVWVGERGSLSVVVKRRTSSIANGALTLSRTLTLTLTHLVHSKWRIVRVQLGPCTSGGAVVVGVAVALEWPIAGTGRRARRGADAPLQVVLSHLVRVRVRVRLRNRVRVRVRVRVLEVTLVKPEHHVRSVTCEQRLARARARVRVEVRARARARARG